MDLKNLFSVGSVGTGGGSLGGIPVILRCSEDGKVVEVSSKDQSVGEAKVRLIQLSGDTMPSWQLSMQ